MHKHNIVALVGSDAYTRACTLARAAAPYTGQGNTSFVFDSTLPHHISDCIWDSDTTLTDKEKIDVLFAVYTDMPCYALLMEVPMHYDHQLSAQAKAAFWQQVRLLLSQDDDTLAEPIDYLLWCDFFEFTDRCTTAWNEVTRETINANLIRRILSVAGPVPFHLKEPLFTKLMQESAWHPALFASLRASYDDIYGQIDTKKAIAMLEQLIVPSAMSDLQHFRQILQERQDSAAVD